MAVSRKSLHIFERSVETFFERNRDVFFWTFTFAENVSLKAEAEKRFKAFRDRVARKGGEMLGVWERQERGAWHVHVLINYYEAVDEIRPWMMERGWGKFCRVEKVVRQDKYVNGVWRDDPSQRRKIHRYLVKYLTKASTAISETEKKKKMLVSLGQVKIGTTRFSWMPHIAPGTYLWYWGRRFYFELYRTFPSFEARLLILTMGAEYVDHYEFDPWYVP